MPDFPVVAVEPASVIGDEALGSKPKFWFRVDGDRWLFKEARENTGEDWAEKLAAEIAPIVGIPAATVELADFNGRRGCASRSFVNLGQGDTLIHGNEILAGVLLGYNPKKKFKQSDHTLENIEKAINNLLPEQGLRDEVLERLASYVVFDALIGNTDRHHENWALVLRLTSGQGEHLTTMEVGPTFDHASSLGRELRDARRQTYLQRGTIGDYVRNGHGAIYLGQDDRHGANPLRLAEFGVRRYPQYFAPSLRRLAQCDLRDLQQIVERVPGDRMSPVAKDFVKAFLAYTFEALRRLDQ